MSRTFRIPRIIVTDLGIPRWESLGSPLQKKKIRLVFSIWSIVKGAASLVLSETVLVGQKVGLCFTKHTNY